MAADPHVSDSRVRVEEKALVFPLHLCIYQDKTPCFDELVDKLRHASAQQVRYITCCMCI